MKKLYILLFAILISSLSFGQIVINEIDADTPGTDVAEFVELLWTPNTSLDGLTVVFYNGSNDQSYAAYDLDGKTTDSNGFFILANTPLVSGSDIDLGASNALQNGADAVAIYNANDTDFPSNTPVTNTNLVDALVYGTGDADDAGLLAGLGESVQYDESANSASATESLQRKNDGTYETKSPTFRDSNDAAVCELSLTSTSATCDTFTVGADTYTATVDFAGGGTATYNVTSTSGVVGGDNPTSMPSGTITVTGVAEGTDITVNVENGGLCNLDVIVTSPTCLPAITLPHYENFAYADGSLVGNGAWAASGGTPGDLLVSSGQAVVKADNSASEDVYLPFTPVTGKIYFGIDFTVNAAATVSGGDYEYFAHFKDSGFGYFGRLDVVAPTSSGDYTLGISTETSTAQATWGTDLTFGVTYRAVVMYDQDANLAQLWIDATADTDPSILGTDLADPGISIESFGLRQSGSSSSETVTVDNLNIGTTFGVVLSIQDNQIEGFSFYPNPTSLGYVNISSKNNANMSVAVFDILGKQVLNKTVNNNTLDVSGLTSGIYIMKVSQENAISTKKLVIQ